MFAARWIRVLAERVGLMGPTEPIYLFGRSTEFL
jgi:hypothetical protein